MEIWLSIVGIGIVCFCFPYIRCFFKRLNCLLKIKKLCREKGYDLHGTHPLWFLGSNEGKNCDCTIETAEELFAIKLFGMPRRKRVLVFKEKEEYVVRGFVGVCLWIRETFDSKARPFPKYDFSMNGTVVTNGKKLRKILLVNPVPMEMLRETEGRGSKLSPLPIDALRQAEMGMENIINPGDEVYGMEIANLSWILKEL